MQSQEMRQAMNTLREFSEKETQFHLYQARQDYLREQATIAYEKKRAEKKARRFLKERDVALQEKELVMQEKELAMQEIQKKDSALQEKDAVLQQKDSALQESLQKEALALAEIERLKKLLNQA